MYIKKNPVERTSQGSPVFAAAVDAVVRKWIPATVFLLSCAVTPARAKMDVRSYDWAPQQGWITGQSVTAQHRAGIWEHGSVTPDRRRLDVRQYEWSPESGWTTNQAVTAPQFAAIWHHGGRTDARPTLDVRTYEWAPQSGWITGQAVTAQHRAGVYDTGGRTAAAPKLDVRTYDWAPSHDWIFSQLPVGVTSAQLAGCWDTGGLTRDRSRLDVRGHEWGQPAWLANAAATPPVELTVPPVTQLGNFRTPAGRILDVRTHDPWSPDQAGEIENVFPRVATIIDDFNRANSGPPLSASWSTQSGVGLVVSTNQATAASGTTSTFERYDGAVYGPDVDHFITVSTIPISGHTVVLYARLDVVTNGYAVAVIGASPDLWVIQRLDAGAGTTLGAAFTQDLSNGDKVGIRCQGGTIEAWYQPVGGRWTRLATRSDSTYSQGGKVALAAQATTVRLDDLGGGTINTPTAVTSDQLSDIWDTGGLTGARRALDVRTVDWAPQQGWIFANLPAATPPTAAQIAPALVQSGERTPARLLETLGYDWAQLFGVPDDPLFWPFLWDTGGRTIAAPKLDVRTYDWSPSQGWIYTNLPVAAVTTAQLPGVYDHGGRTADRPRLDVRQYEWTPEPAWFLQTAVTAVHQADIYDTGGLTPDRRRLDVRGYEWAPSNAWIFQLVPTVTSAQLSDVWDTGGRTDARAKLDVRSYDWQPQPAWIVQVVPVLTTAQIRPALDASLASFRTPAQRKPDVRANYDWSPQFGVPDDPRFWPTLWHTGGRTVDHAKLDLRYVDCSAQPAWIYYAVPVATAAQLAPNWEHGGRTSDRPRLDVRAFEWQPEPAWLLASAVTFVQRADIWDTGGRTDDRARLDVRTHEWAPQGSWLFVQFPEAPPTLAAPSARTIRVPRTGRAIDVPRTGRSILVPRSRRTIPTEDA